MRTTKNLMLLAVLFFLIFTSCRDTKKEEPTVTLKTEKTVPQDEEEESKDDNTESEQIKDDYKDDSEIEESEEETDTLSIEE